MGGMAGMSLLGGSVAVGQQPSTWAEKLRVQGVGEAGHGDRSGIPGLVARALGGFMCALRCRMGTDRT